MVGIAQMAGEIAMRAREASRTIARADTETKNEVLRRMAMLLEERGEEIVKANAQDVEGAGRRGLRPALVERLVFDKRKIQARIRALMKIAALADPVGQIYGADRRPNGLMVGRMRVPLGVILMIYEARPHVTVNGGALALKAGNALILKGGSEAKLCNALLGRFWMDALETCGLPTDAVQVVSFGHDAVHELLKQDDLIDVVIPRGGKELIKDVRERSRIPLIKHFEGVCHVYVAHGADKKKALDIILDSKLLMPAVCNAAETVLVDEALCEWLPDLVSALRQNKVEVRGCPVVCRHASDVKPASEDDWSTEYLDRIYSIKAVSDADEAIEHITRYGSGHTDVIVTEDYSLANRFIQEVDSSVVLVNASTMFCDGESLGMGAEVGISTDKLHARGPVGLEGLTSYKFVVFGDGQIMGQT